MDHCEEKFAENCTDFIYFNHFVAKKVRIQIWYNEPGHRTCGSDRIRIRIHNTVRMILEIFTAEKNSFSSKQMQNYQGNKKKSTQD
jgi:hypothetical protein